MPRTYLYRIVLRDGRKFEVEAENGVDACKSLNLSREDCKSWYPMALKAIPTKEEKEAMRLRFKKLKEQHQARI